MRISTLLLMLLFLTACGAALPTQAPPPTQDATAVAVAAEATVTAMAAENPPAQPALTATQPAAAATVTAEPVVIQPAQFWITYLSSRRLAVMNDDGASTLITNTPGMDYLPRWSPDGKLLAFVRFDGSSTQDGILHILPAGSDTPRQVDPANKYNYFTWMPDNRTLLAVSNYSGMHDITLVDTASGQASRIAQNVTEYPRLSPDGSKILLLINTGNTCNGKGCTYPNDFHLYDVATRQLARLSGDGQPKIGSGWSPDGLSFAYFLAEDTTGSIYLMQPDGTLLGPQAGQPLWINPWVLSPDGSLVAYAKNLTGEGAVEVLVQPYGGGELRRVARIEQSADVMAYIDTLRWRPDGLGLVFNSWVDVYTVDLDGSNLRRLPVKLENVFFDVRPTVDAFIPPPVPTAPVVWKLCPGALDSRLDIGKQARVSTNPPSPNNVRIGPDKRADLIGQIQPGERIEILGGPICEDGATWWEIRSLATGMKGYTLEGDNTTYWLEPVN